MKNLNIPTLVDNSINLIEIDSDYSGIIICYKDDNPVGYIVNLFEEYHFYNNISVTENPYYREDKLFTLIHELIANQECTNFKVIEFE